MELDAKPYQDAIQESLDYYSDYQERCDNIDKLYANMERMADVSRDREFAIFWANLEVLRNVIYSRPPVPVVAPRFKDRSPIVRQASEILERCLSYSFEEFTQGKDRIHRIGQDKSCLYIYLIAKDTIDEQLLAILQKKKDIQEAVRELMG